MVSSATCRPAPCPYCLCRISPHDFYEMMRFRAELRRKGKRRAS